MLNEAIKEANAKLCSRLVPAKGPAKSKAGELLRAVNHLESRFWFAGEMVGVDNGNETCNPAARYILTEIDDYTQVYEITEEIWGFSGLIDSKERYGELVNELLLATLYYIKDFPELKKEANPAGFEKYQEDEDFWYSREWWQDNYPEEFGCYEEDEDIPLYEYDYVR